MKRLLLLLYLLVAASLNCAQAQFNKNYFFYMGREYIIGSRYNEAIDMLNILLKYDPKAYEGYFLRGVAKYNLDDLHGAEADFTNALEKNPVFTTAYQYRAITRSRLGNYDQALRDFQEAIDLRPDIAGSYYSRGVTFLLTKQLDYALEDFNRFIRYEPKVADAYINRGMCYLYKKDTTAAFAEFNTAIKTNRFSPDGFNRRGNLYYIRGQYAEALSDFNQALQNDSLSVPAYFSRALVYASTKRPMPAIADLDRVISIDSTNSLPYFNRAIIRSQIGDYNRALEDYDVVADRNPNNVLVFYNRAALYTQLGDYRAAVADYSRAINLYPDFANAYLGRSSLKHQMGDMKGSKRDYDIATRKIAEYRARLSDSTSSAFADTTRRFDRLLAFDSEFGADEMNGTIGNSAQKVDITLMPLYKFTYVKADTAMKFEHLRYRDTRSKEFLVRVADPNLAISNRETDFSSAQIQALAHQLDSLVRVSSPSWQLLARQGAAQSMIRQYTSAINTLTEAIRLDPRNPFLYLNRSTVRSEMIDFISSIDNKYQKIVIDSDPANKLHNRASRTYNYDEAIEDLNIAARLYPEYAYIYYNRGNLRSLSGDMPGAIEDYSRAIELYPYFADAYYNRGLVQIYLKDTKKGCLDISKAGELGIQQAYKILKKYGGGQ